MSQPAAPSPLREVVAKQIGNLDREIRYRRRLLGRVKSDPFVLAALEVTLDRLLDERDTLRSYLASEGDGVAVGGR